MSDGAVFFDYDEYKDGEWAAVHAEVIEEGSLTMFVNGEELATILCTPRYPAQLALGFLRNEGFIHQLQEVEVLYVCPSGGCVDIWLSHSIDGQPRRKTITTGCSGGLTFTDLIKQRQPILNELQISPEKLGELIAQLQNQESLYARARGVHTSGLSDGEKLVLVAEDIGRHNTLDRLHGECLLQGIDPAGMALLSTGRVSSEMINKAAEMGCALVASRTSPTSLSVSLARAWNMTLCGYVRRKSMNVYAHPERLVGARFPVQTADYWLALPDS